MQGEAFSKMDRDNFASEIRAAAEKLGRAATPEFEFIRRHISTLEERVKASSRKNLIGLDQCTIQLFVEDKAASQKMERKVVVPADELKSPQNIAILGDPGSGKSVFLQRMAIAHAKSYAEGDKIPAYVRLGDYDGSDMEDFLISQIGDDGFGDQARAMLHQGRFELLLDGLDEAVVERARLMKHLQNLGALNRNRIYIASRQNTYQDLPGFQSALLEPLQIRRIKEFLQEKYEKTPYDYKALYGKIEKESPKLDDEEETLTGLADFCRNPLLLSFIMKLYENSVDKGEEFEVRDKTHLYDQIVELFFEREEEKGRDKTLLGKKIDVFSEIAFQAQAANGTGLVSRTDVEAIVDAVVEGSDEYKADVWREIDDNNLLRFNEEKRVYEFGMHKTLQEYFCARAIAKKISSQEDELTAAEAWRKYFSFTEDNKIWKVPEMAGDDFLGALPAWENTLHFLAGMLGQQDMNELLEKAVQPYFAIKDTAEKKSPDLPNILLRMLGGASYSNAQDYNPFVYNMVLAANLIHNSRKEKPDAKRREIAKKLLEEIRLAELVLRVQDGRNNEEELSKKVYTGLGYSPAIVEFTYKSRGFFGVVPGDPEKTLRLLDGFEGAKGFVDAARSVVDSNPERLEKRGFELCKALSSLGTEESIALLSYLKENFSSVKPIKNYMQWNSERPLVDKLSGNGMHKDPEDGAERLDDILQAIEGGKENRDSLITELLGIVHGEGKVGLKTKQRAKAEVFRYAIKHPSLLLGMGKEILKSSRYLVEYSDAGSLIKIFESALKHGSKDLSTWCHRMGETGNDQVVPALAGFLSSDHPDAYSAGYGLSQISTVESYRALAEYIKQKKTHYVLAIDFVGKMRGIDRLEEIARTGVMDTVLDDCKADSDKFMHAKEMLQALGDEKAVEVIGSYIISVDKRSGPGFQSATEGGFADALEALGPIAARLRKKGLAVDPELFEIVARAVTRESKLIQWHDIALRGLDPVRYIHFAQSHIPPNYSNAGIVPLYAAIFKCHNEMKPQEYRAPERGAA